MIFAHSVVRRYLLISLLVSMVPALAVGLLYDRYSSILLDELMGQRLTVQLAAMSKRLEAFLDARRYQVETLADHPAVAGMRQAVPDDGDEEAAALLQLESDAPDLYGIVFLTPSGGLAGTVTGQAASGPPYWPEAPFDAASLPVTRSAAVQLLGPQPPSDGLSGWFLIRHALLPGAAGRDNGSIALQVRLASLTELMGEPSLAGVVQPVLRTPGGYFNTVGQRIEPGGRLVAGPEIAPGWQPLLQIEPAELLRPFERARRVLFVSVVAAAIVVLLLYARLAHHLRRRVDRLVQGAGAIAAGRLDFRTADDGKDEIAAVSSAFNTMAASLQSMVERLVRMERLASLGEFATGIAHEVRNPLAAIKTTVQALARREPDARRRQLLGDVESEVTRLARVVNDLSDFGRPRPPEPAPVALRELLRRVEGLVASEVSGRTLAYSSQAEPGITLFADRDQLIQILLNLVLNAIQATSDGGSVAVRATRDGGLARVDISDTGCGIAPQALPQVTEPFFTTRPKGMGLGLSISKQLAELNGCSLEFTSVLGRGTSVLLRIPLVHEENPGA